MNNSISWDINELSEFWIVIIVLVSSRQLVSTLFLVRSKPGLMPWSLSPSVRSNVPIFFCVLFHQLIAALKTHEEYRTKCALFCIWIVGVFFFFFHFVVHCQYHMSVCLSVGLPVFISVHLVPEAVFMACEHLLTGYLDLFLFSFLFFFFVAFWNSTK